MGTKYFTHTLGCLYVSQEQAFENLLKGHVPNTPIPASRNVRAALPGVKWKSELVQPPQWANELPPPSSWRTLINCTPLHDIEPFSYGAYLANFFSHAVITLRTRRNSKEVQGILIKAGLTYQLHVGFGGGPDREFIPFPDK
jgi:hypothetical protein